MFQGITIRDDTGSASATILPEYGFNCISWQVAHQQQPCEMLFTLPGFVQGTERPSSSGIPILFPFPNRIRDGHFSWQGTDYQLPKNHQQKNAIHGFVYDKPFNIIHQSSSRLTGEFQLSRNAPDKFSLWPADFILTVDYQIQQQELISSFTIKNPESTKTLPWGLGTHSYFRLPLGNNGNAGDDLIFAPAAAYWELIESLPSGKILPVNSKLDLQNGKKFSDCSFDDVLTRLSPQDGKIISRITNQQQGITLTQITDPEFSHLVVFTPPHRNAVCLEPYTCVTDAINIKESTPESGWQDLAPGQSKTLEIRLKVDFHVQ